MTQNPGSIKSRAKFCRKINNKWVWIEPVSSFEINVMVDNRTYNIQFHKPVTVLTFVEDMAKLFDPQYAFIFDKEL